GTAAHGRAAAAGQTPALPGQFFALRSTRDRPGTSAPFQKRAPSSHPAKRSERAGNPSRDKVQTRQAPITSGGRDQFERADGADRNVGNLFFPFLPCTIRLRSNFAAVSFV